MPAVELPSHGSWGALTPREAVDLLSAVRSPWWIAGGWALDLYLGKVTRSHYDLDIGIFRKDVGSVLAELPGWEFFEAKDGVLTQLVEGKAPHAEVNSLWCKRANAAQWELELMLESCNGEFWVFRREARIKYPRTRMLRRNPEGIAYLAPEIQLLYKARATRARDQVDFDQVVPELTQETRTWLRDSLMSIDPEHAWISMLKLNPAF
jgi:hypothetical protein